MHVAVVQIYAIGICNQPTLMQVFFVYVCPPYANHRVLPCNVSFLLCMYKAASVQLGQCSRVRIRLCV